MTATAASTSRDALDDKVPAGRKVVVGDRGFNVQRVRG
jgi:hypothetical protein